jgi:hypothetical protein
MEITLHDQVEALKQIENVSLVYCNEPDFDVRTQIGDEPAIAFNIERGDKLITLVVVNSYWQTTPFTPEAAAHISGWFNFMDAQDIKTQTFSYRVSEDCFIRLKGTLKMEQDEIPENAQKLAEVYKSVDHVIGVKIRKIFDYQLSNQLCCTEALQFYCMIDIRSLQSEYHINMYCPKNIWDNPEEFENQKARLAEQIEDRIEQEKRLFG